MRIAVALGTVVLALLASSTAAAAPSTYTDPSGDSKTAPDITKVIVTDNGNGTLGFEIDLGTVQDLADNASVAVGIDSDKNAQTGNSGVDFIVVVVADQASIAFGKWDGTQFSSFQHQPLNSALAGGRLTFTITASDIGSPSSFNFFVSSFHGNDQDDAPDGTAVYTYPASKAVAKILIPGAVLLPTAGKLYSARGIKLVLADNTVVAPDSETCTLTLAGKKVAPVAPCRWRIPKKAKHKKGVLTIVLTYQGATMKQSMPVTVR